MHGGQVYTQQSITPSNQVSEFIIRNASKCLLLVNSQTGNLYISGRLYPGRNTGSLLYPDKMFRFRHSDGTTGGFLNPQQYNNWLLDAWNPNLAGSLVLHGQVIYLP